MRGATAAWHVFTKPGRVLLALAVLGAVAGALVQDARERAALRARLRASKPQLWGEVG